MGTDARNVHSCDNPGCVNPAHLRLGTAAENMRDKVERGRGVSFPGSRNPQAILTEESVKEIRSLYKRGIVGYKKLAKLYGVTSGAIEQIIKRKNWNHID